MSMKHVVLAGLASLALGTAAMAETSQGVIASVNPANNTVTLKDGWTFALPHKDTAGTFAPGDKLTIHWYMDGTAKKVDSVEVAQG